MKTLRKKVDVVRSSQYTLEVPGTEYVTLWTLVHVEVNWVELLISKKAQYSSIIVDRRENQTRHTKGSKFPVHVRSSRSVLEAPGTFTQCRNLRIDVFSY
jgi:hypothetical protein